MAILLTYGPARILLAGDAEVREEFITIDLYEALNGVRVHEYKTGRAFKFRALLTEGGTQRVELAGG